MGVYPIVYRNIFHIYGIVRHAGERIFVDGAWSGSPSSGIGGVYFAGKQYAAGCSHCRRYHVAF